MKKYNPIYIPRNHLVEEVLGQARVGDYSEFHNFLEILKNPYTYRDDSRKYMENIPGFDETFTSYCGT